MSDRPRTSALQKELDTEELVYGTITESTLNNKGVGKIKWRHLSTGNEVTHDVSQDKLSHENCYRNLDVGATYIICQKLVSHTRGGRWIWSGAQLVTPREARWVMEKCGFMNVDMELWSDCMTAIKEKRKQIKKPSLADSFFDF